MIIVFFRSWKRLTGPWNFVTVKYQLCTPVTVTIFDGYLMDIIQILYFVNFPRDFCPPTSTNFRSSFSEFLAPRCVKLHGSFGTSQLLCCRAPQCASWKVAPMAFGLDDFHEILWFSLIFWFWDSITIDSIIYIYINNQLYIYIYFIYHWFLSIFRCSCDTESATLKIEKIVAQISTAQRIQDFHQRVDDPGECWLWNYEPKKKVTNWWY